MNLDPSIQMWATFAVIAVTVAFYVTERATIEITSVGCVVALLALFHFMPLERSAITGEPFNPNALLAGFASPALITILSLLVIGQGLVQTGALERPTQLLQSLGSNRSGLALIITLIVACVTSAFLNNTPVVVMFIPIVSAVSAKFGINPSRTLMPLSFITILGGMTTLIGSSTNVLVAGVAESYVGYMIGFFDFVVPGVLLAAIGATYVIFVAPLLLRPGQTMAAELGGTGGKQFIAQITVTPGHPLEGQAAVAGLFPALKDMTVRLVQRGEHAHLPPFEDVTLSVGDVVILAATRKALTDALVSRAGVLTAETGEPDAAGNGETGAEGTEPLRSGGLTLAEAVVAPGSRIVGRKVEEVGLYSSAKCIIIGVQRRSRMIRVQLSEIRLEAGDLVLVLGTRQAVRGLRASHDFLLLEWSATELPDLALAARAQAIFAATVICAATGLLPIVMAALAGAFAMVPAGCLNLRQSARAFDRRIYLLIGASLAMATSLEVTGGAEYVAANVVDLLSGWGTAALLSGFFLLVACMTNLLSNHATAALFTPIGINAAYSVGVEPSVFVFTVILAANCSFASPMGYQTNLLVMGSGHYKFADFLRAGTPLVFLLWVVYSLFAPWYYGL